MIAIDKKQGGILVVDDDQSMRERVRRALEEADYQVEEAANGARAIGMIRQYPYDVVITELRPPGAPGEMILQEALSSFPETVVIVTTESGNVLTAVETVRMGAWDYLRKPFQLDEMVMRVERGLKERQLQQENTRLRIESQGKYLGVDVVGNSSPMRQIYCMIGMIADKTSTVLITGEAGTGKELVARAIHYSGPRRIQPMVCVNCRAIAGGLFEDELFGHVKGGIKGDEAHKGGSLEQANHGTLYLNEVGDVPLPVQGKLRRAIQEREFQKIGGTANIKVDVRIIAATSGDLLEKVRRGEFSENLYDALNEIPICLPPLRKRREDIPLLLSHFLRKYCSERSLSLKGVSQEAVKVLSSFDWFGNADQLESSVENAVLSSYDREVLVLDDFAEVSSHRETESPYAYAGLPKGGVDFNTVVSDLERHLLVQSLEIAQGNHQRAAELLNLKRTTFVEKLKRLRPEASEDKRPH